jgi:hypothetical protein
LHIVLWRVEARSNSADDLAVNDDWKAALHLEEARTVTAAKRPW